MASSEPLSGGSCTSVNTVCSDSDRPVSLSSSASSASLPESHASFGSGGSLGGSLPYGSTPQYPAPQRNGSDISLDLTPLSQLELRPAGVTPRHPPSPWACQQEDRAKLTREERVVLEIVETEQAYVQDLKSIVEGFWLSSELLEDLERCSHAAAIAECFVERVSDRCTRGFSPAKQHQFMARWHYGMDPAGQVHGELKRSGLSPPETGSSLTSPLGFLCVEKDRKTPTDPLTLQEIESVLLNWAGPDLSGFGELVLEGTFRVQRVKKERAFFLFDKMLLIAKKRGDSFIYSTHIFHAGSEGELCPAVNPVCSFVSTGTLASSVIEVETREGEEEEEKEEEEEEVTPTLSITEEILEFINQSRARELGEAGGGETDQLPAADEGHLQVDPVLEEETSADLGATAPGMNREDLRPPLEVIELDEEDSSGGEPLGSRGQARVKEPEPRAPASESSEEEEEEGQGRLESGPSPLHVLEELEQEEGAGEPETPIPERSNCEEELNHEGPTGKTFLLEDGPAQGVAAPDRCDPLQSAAKTTLTKDDRLLIEKIKTYYETGEAIAPQLQRRDSISFIPAGLVKDSVSRFHVLVQQDSICESETGRSESSETEARLSLSRQTSAAESETSDFWDAPEAERERGEEGGRDHKTEAAAGGDRVCHQEEPECEYRSCTELMKVWKEKEGRAGRRVQEETKAKDFEKTPGNLVIRGGGHKTEAAAGGDRVCNQEEPECEYRSCTELMKVWKEKEGRAGRRVQEETKAKDFEKTPGNLVIQEDMSEASQKKGGGGEEISGKARMASSIGHCKTVLDSERHPNEESCCPREIPGPFPSPDVTGISLYEGGGEVCLAENSEKIISKVQMLARMYSARIGRMKTPLHKKVWERSRGPAGRRESGETEKKPDCKATGGLRVPREPQLYGHVIIREQFSMTYVQENQYIITAAKENSWDLESSNARAAPHRLRPVEPPTEASESTEPANPDTSLQTDPPKPEQAPPVTPSADPSPEVGDFDLDSQSSSEAVPGIQSHPEPESRPEVVCNPTTYNNEKTVSGALLPISESALREESSCSRIDARLDSGSAASVGKAEQSLRSLANEEPSDVVSREPSRSGSLLSVEEAEQSLNAGSVQKDTTPAQDREFRALAKLDGLHEREPVLPDEGQTNKGCSCAAEDAESSLVQPALLRPKPILPAKSRTLTTSKWNNFQQKPVVYAKTADDQVQYSIQTPSLSDPFSSVSDRCTPSAVPPYTRRSLGNSTPSLWAKTDPQSPLELPGAPNQQEPSEDSKETANFRLASKDLSPKMCATEELGSGRQNPSLSEDRTKDHCNASSKMPQSGRVSDTQPSNVDSSELKEHLPKFTSQRPPYLPTKSGRRSLPLYLEGQGFSSQRLQPSPPCFKDSLDHQTSVDRKRSNPQHSQQNSWNLPNFPPPLGKPDSTPSSTRQEGKSSSSSSLDLGLRTRTPSPIRRIPSPSGSAALPKSLAASCISQTISQSLTKKNGHLQSSLSELPQPPSASLPPLSGSALRFRSPSPGRKSPLGPVYPNRQSLGHSVPSLTEKSDRLGTTALQLLHPSTAGPGPAPMISPPPFRSHRSVSPTVPVSLHQTWKAGSKSFDLSHNNNNNNNNNNNHNNTGNDTKTADLVPIVCSAGFVRSSSAQNRLARPFSSASEPSSRVPSPSPAGPRICSPPPIHPTQDGSKGKPPHHPSNPKPPPRSFTPLCFGSQDRSGSSSACSTPPCTSPRVTSPPPIPPSLTQSLRRPRGNSLPFISLTDGCPSPSQSSRRSWGGGGGSMMGSTDSIDQDLGLSSSGKVYGSPSSCMSPGATSPARSVSRNNSLDNLGTQEIATLAWPAVRQLRTKYGMEKEDCSPEREEPPELEPDPPSGTCRSSLVCPYMGDPQRLPVGLADRSSTHCSSSGDQAQDNCRGGGLKTSYSTTVNLQIGGSGRIASFSIAQNRLARPFSSASEPSSRVPSPSPAGPRICSPPPIHPTQDGSKGKPPHHPSNPKPPPRSFTPLCFGSQDRSGSSSACSTPPCTSPRVTSPPPIPPSLTQSLRRPRGNSLPFISLTDGCPSPSRSSRRSWGGGGGSMMGSTDSIDQDLGLSSSGKVYGSPSSCMSPGATSPTRSVSRNNSLDNLGTQEIATLAWPAVRQLRTKYGMEKEDCSPEREEPPELEPDPPSGTCRSSLVCPYMGDPQRLPVGLADRSSTHCSSSGDQAQDNCRGGGLKTSYSTTVNLQIGGSGRIASFSIAQVSLTQTLAVVPESLSTRRVNVNGYTVESSTNC
ncbi:UNVERIFIED_CONTAM: hypothetical protein FKN15_025481 [Acipenser sinensis]